MRPDSKHRQHLLHGWGICHHRSRANLTIDGAPRPEPSSSTVFQWETYRILNLTGDITVESTGPVPSTLFGTSSDAGWSGYYSGFSLNTNAT